MATYNIKGYWMPDDKNVLDKEPNLLLLFTVSGNIKRATDMIRPVINISNHPSDDWSRCNYIYIEMFHRYYFVVSKTYDTFGNIEIECVVDPLSSHVNDIKNLFVIAKRSSNLNKCNLYQEDAEIPRLEYQVVATQKFPGGFGSGEALILANNGGGIVI